VPERPRPEATFRALTGLRFLAAAHVVWFHVGPTTGVAALDRIRSWGWTAVTLFFVLSGFVLAHRYPRLDGRDALRGFWWARIARIFPAHAFALVATLLALVATGALASWPAGWTGRPLGFAVELLLLHAWIPLTGGLNLPDWTLSVEVAFYALFPLILPRLARLGRGPPIGLAALCVAAYAASFGVAQAIATGLGPIPPSPGGFGWFNNLPLTRLPAFVLGMALARWVAEPEGARVLERRAPLLTLVGAVGTLALMAATALPWPALESMGTALLPFQALLVLGLAGDRGPLGRLLGSRPLVRLGDWSYGIYLYQLPVLIALGATWPRDHGRFGSFTGFGAYLLLLVAASGLLFHLLEDPARRSLRRLGA